MPKSSVEVGCNGVSVRGKSLSTIDTVASTLGKDNPIRYRGYYYDTETGLYYLQSRYYDPDTGRFINADDVAFLGATGTVLSRNLFVYCENNPVVLFDPTGCSPANVIGAVVGGIGGAVIGTALVKHFHLTGWKKWLVLGSITGLMAIVGWFAGPAIYATLKPIVIKAITACTLAVGAIKEWALKALGIAQRYINQALRIVNKNLLRFSNTALNHMNDPDRAVPVKFLLECIKHGKALPDPRGSQAIMYTIKMYKNGKSYILEVLFDWATNTIWHFCYKP